jgi:hypothetical protein
MVKPHTAEPLPEVAVNAHSQLLELIRVLRRDAVARALFTEEAIEEGDAGMALAVARDLGFDVRAAISEYEAAA